MPTDSHGVYQKVPFSMTLSDPDFEVTSFFEIECLGPDWSYVWDQVFDFL